MRFVTGLIVGVATVLVLAAVLGPGTVDSEDAAAARLATGSAMPLPTNQAEEAGAEEAIAEAGRAESPLSEVPAPQTGEYGTGAAMTAAAEPGPPSEPAASEPIVEPLVEETVAASAGPTVETSPEQDLSGEVIAPAEEVTTEAVAADADTAAGQLAVWRPFHSEASADGFARRLSSQLGYPFKVVRVAAAEYHVVFDYADGSERELLRRQVATLTGRQP